MRKRLYILVFVLLISSNLSVGKHRNKTKNARGSNKNLDSGHSKTKSDLQRIKRSINDEDDKPFWANRGKKQSEEDLYSRYDYSNFRTKNKILKASENILSDPPFWGNRGRRDSSSVEDFLDSIEYPKTKCQHCNDHFYTPFNVKESSIERRLDSPFWGNRGRRNSAEVSVDDDVGNSSPFRGNRGRRQEDEPFWGNRGRREDENPFWGNRGRREDVLPFWGNRGRRTKLSKFGNWAQERNNEHLWGNRRRRKDLKDSIPDAIDQVEDDIVNISQLTGTSSTDRTLFWKNQGRNSALKYLFSGVPRYKSNINQPIKTTPEDGVESYKNARSMHDSRIYADEPHYIVVDRSSRSSGELVDPFYITRGKKELDDLELEKVDRGRRGTIEEIAKSVKNDPFFIVRGKKDFGENNIKVNASMQNKVSKTKDLICATLSLILAKTDSGEVKREVGESDRGRRATLKKLAAQLQIDPYFVSRGKKSAERIPKEEKYEEFINQVSEMCT